jgi:hypothetical protein
MKKIIALLLAAAAMLSLFSGCAAKDNSAYVPTGDALFQDTTTVPQQQQQTPTSQVLNVSFDPTGTLTRAQLCALLAQAMDLSASTENHFTDVPSDRW